MMRMMSVLLLAMVTLMGCHPGPVLSPKLAANGTIAGIVSYDTKTAVEGRKVTVTDVATGAKFDAITGVNGGYTIKVPEGTYKIELELKPGERILKQPGETKIQKSDLDPQRDFTISAK